jgi:hypothetical protein
MLGEAIKRRDDLREIVGKLGKFPAGDEILNGFVDLGVFREPETGFSMRHQERLDGMILGQQATRS